MAEIEEGRHKYRTCQIIVMRTAIALKFTLSWANKLLLTRAVNEFVMTDIMFTPCRNVKLMRH